MKVDRDPNRPVKHLEWRVRLLGVGAVLALAGMMMERGWMVNLAIGVLLVGFVLRYLPDPKEADDPPPEDAHDEPGPEPADPDEPGPGRGPADPDDETRP